VIPASLAAAGLAVTVALGPALDPDPALLAERQRILKVEHLVEQANECIARQVVAADKRYRRRKRDLADLIVGAVPMCVEQIRAMVEGYDRYFGDGSGRSFSWALISSCCLRL
jgi:hypothetical protein